ncbi:MAG: flagellar motor switch protein FliN [Acidimicrobiia bacterium]|nr:flagellar motor switch protein FliN [Acidimicrobiia bacterium]
MPDLPIDNQSALEEWLLEQWVLHLGRAIEAMTGEAPIVKYSADAQEPSAEDRLWWHQPFNLSSGSLIWVGASTHTWSSIGAQVLRAAGIDESTPEDHRGSYFEVLQQALSGVAQSLTGLLRAEVLCAAGAGKPQPPECSAFLCDIGLQDKNFNLMVAFSEELTSTVRASQRTKHETPATAPASSGPGTALAESPAPGLPDTRQTISLLFDVELPLSISFGRAHLTLKEVLKLTSGSIVELNRTVVEPVEIIINNCVIARGEVVVVEGNYGVRINQIVSRNERLRTLH